MRKVLDLVLGKEISLLITMDDGYFSNYDLAYPLFKNIVCLRLCLQ